MALTYKERTVRGRRVFWFAFGVLVVMVASLLFVAYRFWGIQRDPLVDPVLKGAPQFIVLSLVVAFAVYLRQVSTNASELRDKIREGNVWNYPAAHSKQRMEALDGISEKISVAAPFMILLTIERMTVDSRVVRPTRHSVGSANRLAHTPSSDSRTEVGCDHREDRF